MITTQNISNLSKLSVVLAYYNGNMVLKNVAPCNQSCLVELGEVTFDDLEKYENEKIITQFVGNYFNVQLHCEFTL